MSAVGKIPFFTNLQCESAMPWEELTNQLEIGIKRFSNGEIEQPVRAMLPITEHSGFLGKFFFDRELVYRCLIRFFLFLTATLRNLFQHYISDYQHEFELCIMIVVHTYLFDS